MSRMSPFKLSTAARAVAFSFEVSWALMGAVKEAPTRVRARNMASPRLILARPSSRLISKNLIRHAPSSIGSRL